MSMPDLNGGALAPVRDEVTITDLPLQGQIPAALNGSLVRNGPNPYSGAFEGEGVLSWWPEAAMLHGIEIANGKAVAYRNRWARTKSWARHNETDETPFTETNPNVNVLVHADTILALAEGSAPVEIDHELNTLGLSAAHEAVATGMCAHPKVDRQSGELMWFRSDFAPPFLRYGVLNADGSAAHEQNIDLASPAMMHDMAITQRYSLFMDTSVGLDLSLFEKGFRIPVCWQDDRPSRIALVPRRGGDPIWVEIESCFIQHVINAYDNADGSVDLDVVRYHSYFKLNDDKTSMHDNPLGVAWRYHINPATGAVTETQICDLMIELPRFNESLTGRPYRYFYAVEQPSDQEMRGIIKFDHETGLAQRHSIAQGDQNSEPIFVPRSPSAAEDDGWVLVSVYRQESHSNEVWILDAADIEAPPLAKITLGHRIPAGFHGAWLDAD